MPLSGIGWRTSYALVHGGKSALSAKSRFYRVATARSIARAAAILRRESARGKSSDGTTAAKKKKGLDCYRLESRESLSVLR